MIKIPHPPTRTLAGPLAAALLLAFSLFALTPQPAAAQPCDRSGCGRASCATPAAPAPANLWGELQPADLSFPACVAGGSTACRDSTAFNEFVTPYSAVPWFMAVDSENGYALMALAYGLQVWDGRTTPQSPINVGRLLYSSIPVPSNNAEIKWPIQGIDAPAGVDTVAALASQGGMGLVAVDLNDKTAPKVLYQSTSKDGEQVYAATLGGRQYAFLAASSGNPTGGVFAYDLTAARAVGSATPCNEAYPAPGTLQQCAGVFLGRVGLRSVANYVHGTGNFIVLSSGTSRGFEIWNVADPRTPQLQLTGLSSQSVYGVAMWQAGGHLYLALRTDFFDSAQSRQVNQARIYDVTCVTGTCSGLPAPLSALELDTGTTSFYATYSTSNGTPYIYFGSDDKCRGGNQREWLFDVSNPAAPRDVTPQTGYWGWYYRGNPTGFNQVMPRTGKFVGDYFYRAGLALFDIHKHNTGGVPSPYIFVGGPSVGSTNQALTFTASAALCTPAAGGWNWSTSGGFISGSPTASSVQITWTTQGTKNITATNSGCGSAVGTASVLLGDNSFLSANYSFSPPSPNPGDTVTFDASSTSGTPTHYVWDFGDGGTLNTTNPIATHVYPSAGSYIVRLTVSRPGTGPGCDGAGNCTSDTSKAVLVGNGGPQLPEANFTANVNCVNQFGFETCSAIAGQAVTLSAAATTTTSGYNWTFGDGTTGSGQVVSHTWSTPGSYVVQLTVSNARGTNSKTKTFTVSTDGPVGGCTPTANRLCLNNNRFAVDVTWRTPAGQTGQGMAVQLTRDTGYFWFFDSSNVEMILKILDACSLNQRFWVFAGGLTNVMVNITVNDTQTGLTKTYNNAQSTPFQPVQDTDALKCTAGSSAQFFADLAELTEKVGTPSGTALLLGGGRFKVETTYKTPAGATGSGQAVQLTNDTGYFYFFDAANVEMVVKVLNACSINQKFWVFAGGLTNVMVTTTVTDLQTNAKKTYINPQSTPFQPLQDTSALSCP